MIGEVVVVDGNSVDDTLEIVSEFVPKLPLVILSDEGRGLGYARDVGWRATSSPYIIMLDSDVVMEPEFVAEALRIMENDRRVGALSAKLRPKIEEKGWLALFQVKKLEYHLHLSEPTYPEPAVALINACTMFRREALERVGGFDHHFKLADEDIELSFRLRKAGYFLSYLPIEVTHLERAGYRFWDTNFRYGRSYVHISEKHPDMAPLWTFKRAFLTASLLFPPLQLIVYLHYVRRYGEVKGLTLVERIVLPGIEVLREALRTAGMLYELLNR